MRKFLESEVIELTRKFFDVKPEIYFTRGGSIAVVFGSQFGGDRPLIGAYYEESGKTWYPFAWGSDGCLLGSGHPSNVDLILPKTQDNEYA